MTPGCELVLSPGSAACDWYRPRSRSSFKVTRRRSAPLIHSDSLIPAARGSLSLPGIPWYQLPGEASHYQGFFDISCQGKPLTTSDSLIPAARKSLSLKVLPWYQLPGEGSHSQWFLDTSCQEKLLSFSVIPWYQLPGEAPLKPSDSLIPATRRKSNFKFNCSIYRAAAAAHTL